MKETLRQNPLKLYAQVKNLDKEPYVVDLGEVGTPNNGGNLHRKAS
jgi:hypothetical protein